MFVLMEMCIGFFCYLVIVIVIVDKKVVKGVFICLDYLIWFYFFFYVLVSDLILKISGVNLVVGKDVFIGFVVEFFNDIKFLFV